MKLATLIARTLLGLVFLIFGLNGFLHFIPMPPPPGLAGQWMGVMAQSNYLAPIFLVQLIGGALLLSGFYTPLALILLGPVVVNILTFHVLLAPAGLPLALVVAILWLIVFFGVRSAFAGIFAPKVVPR